MKEVFGQEDFLLFFDKNKNRVYRLSTFDATINCKMTFKMFPYDSQDCFFQMVEIERTEVDHLKMSTSVVQFETWPHQFSPTVSEFEYKVKTKPVQCLFGTSFCIHFVSQVAPLETDTFYIPATGWNTSIVGFKITMSRHSSKYIFLYYLPTGM